MILDINFNSNFPKIKPIIVGKYRMKTEKKTL